MGSGARSQVQCEDAVDCLPIPLEQILIDVFKVYEARTPEELIRRLMKRYREDAAYLDNTLMARPRSEVALTLYALQHQFSSIHISGICQPEVQLAPQAHSPSLLQVTVRNSQRYEFSRKMPISQQIFPECSTVHTVTRLLVDPQTGLVLRHEDMWQHRPAFRLPLALRRFNCICTNAVYRLLGWGRELREAEAHCRWEERWEE